MSLFTEKLSQARIKKGMNKTNVADKFGWTVMYYGRYENGYLIPKGDNIKRFAEFIEISEEELVKILQEDEIRKGQ